MYKLPYTTLHHYILCTISDTNQTCYFILNFNIKVKNFKAFIFTLLNKCCSKKLILLQQTINKKLLKSLKNSDFYFHCLHYLNI